MILGLIGGLAALAAPLQVAPGHTVSVGLVQPQVAQHTHGERLMVPVGWQADIGGALADAGYQVLPSHQAEVRLQPTVETSGCTSRRDGQHCSAWVTWRVVGPGNDPQFTTQVVGSGPDPVSASRAVWQAAVAELLGDPGFVQTLHYGPLARYDCAFAGQMAAVPVRISPPPDDGTRYDDHAGGDWTFGFVLGTQEGWLLSGLGLLGGGAAVMGLSVAAQGATDNRAIDQTFEVVGIVGALHFALGASMLGLELTQGRSARVHWTGSGIGVSGRF